MGCIMTPMPNHLSTLKPHHNRVGMEQMRRMVRSVEMVRMRWCELRFKRVI